MRSFLVGVVGVLAAVLFMEGCGGEEEAGDGDLGTLPADVVTGTVAAVEVSMDMVDNLVICHGMQVVKNPKDQWNMETYPDGSGFEDLNPCDWVPAAAIYFSTQAAFVTWAENMEGIQQKTPNFVKAVIEIKDAIGCASLCKENPECKGFEWNDPGFFNQNEGMMDKKWARQCTLAGAPACQEHVDLGPLYNKQKMEIMSFMGRTNLMKFSGYQPDAEWKSKLTDCPYGKQKKVDMEDMEATLPPPDFDR
jgi:hypothetical protein